MQVKTVTVIAGGASGRGIACAAALGGYRVVLEDVSADVLDHALMWIQVSLEERVGRGELTIEKRDDAIGRISTSRSLDQAIRQADLIIETALDEMETKLEIFTLLDKFAKPGAILATSTLSLQISELAAITFRPEHCVGIRFLNPGSDKQRLEIIRTLDTSEETIAACVELGRRMGREVVVVAESEDSTQEAETKWTVA